MLNQTNIEDRREMVSHIVLAAVIFMAVAMPFRALFNLIPGVTEVRPANCLPPIFGLLWGWPGALGAALGNVFSDLATGTSLSVTAIGALINFFFGYLPYKIWYSTRADHDDPLPTMSSVAKIVKYVIIMLLVSFWTTAALSVFMEAFGFASATDVFELFFYNNYDFTLVLGIPALMHLGRKNTTYVVPKESHCGKGKAFFFNSLIFISGALGLGWALISRGVVSQQISMILLVVMLLPAAVNVVRPYDYIQKESKKPDSSIRTSLRFKAMVPMLLLAWLFVVLIGVITLLNNMELSFLEVWALVYRSVGIFINVIFLFIIGALWYVESRIVVPLEHLTENVEAFSEETGKKQGEIPEVHLTEVHTGDEITVLANACNDMMLSISDYSSSLQQVTADREKIKAELNIAASIQRALLPSDFPAFPELTDIDLYAFMDPAKEVGGDFYDFFLVDEDHLAVVMADVSGKGVPAALLMMIGKTLIKIYSKYGLEPGEVFTAVNNILCESNRDDYFITAFEGILNLKTGEFRYANAGHEIPFIEMRGVPFAPHKIRAGLALACMEDMQYKTFSVQFEPGTKIFQYTDGVPEATNAKDELFGMDRLEDVLRSCYLSSPRVILERVKKNVDEFVGDAPQFDDLTMLCLEYKGSTD